MTAGSRFHGGYQFPRTAHAPARRGAPIERWTSPNGRIRLEVSPLEGGRPGWMIDLFDDERSLHVCARSNDETQTRRGFRTTREALAAGERPEMIRGL